MRTLLGVTLLLGAASLIGAVFENSAQEYGAALLALMLAGYPALMVSQDRTDATARMAMGIAAITQPALLLFIFTGTLWQGDLHMIFFAVLAIAAILCDFRVILACAGIVAVHHLVLGMAIPEWVFSGSGSFTRILLHAVVLIAEAAALTWLTINIVRLLDAVSHKEQEREAIEQTADMDRVRRDQELGIAVGELGSRLGALADGDLTADILADFPPAYAELKSNFNTALSSLRELIGSVMESTSTIRTGSGEIAQASEDLARRTENNASSLEETTAAITQMDGRLKATAAAASRTVERADGAITTVSGGRAVADEAVQAMGRVSESAKGIDSVIEGLDKIAFQTRVLAMNAAVEAGRAGDAGRGFAVVADLVSALAMRAEEESKRARDQLTVTQTDIVAAVGAVEKVDAALVNISGDVGEVHKLLGEMAADNQAQSVAVTQISSAIGTMDQATQQNAAMVEQTSAAARNLTSEVAALADQAARFNVGNRPMLAGPSPYRAERTAARRSEPASRVLPAMAMTHDTGGESNWAAF
ncbi:MAG: methyl-accepting chemotaxis protein [Pseudomonadota bacterium]